MSGGQFLPRRRRSFPPCSLISCRSLGGSEDGTFNSLASGEAVAEPRHCV